MSGPILQNSISYDQILTPLDWVVFTLVLLSTYLFVYLGHKLRKKTADKEKAESVVEILLMGRQLTLPFFIATLVATWYGGIFGVTQISFEKGIFNFITQGAFWYLTYIIFALFLVKKINAYEAMTLPELVGKMFGPKSQKLSSWFNLLNVLPIAYVISVGLFLQTLFGGNLTVMSALGVLFVMTYSIGGGFRAIVFSDFFQFFIMCSSVALVVIVSAFKFGTLDYLYAHLPATHFDPMGGESLLTTMVWGFIALSTLVDPNFYHRCFAAESSEVAKKGILLSTVVWFLFDICTTAGGLYAKAAIPDAPSNKAYLIYALQILPEGLRGFMMAGLLTTVISTIDSFLFIAGTTVSYDILPSKWKNKPVVHHMGVAVVGAISILISYFFEGNIKEVWKTLGSFAAACLLIPMVMGHILPKRISDNDFVFSSILAVITMTYWRHTEHTGVWLELDALYIGLFTSLSTLLLLQAKKRMFS
ncbi:MAG: sodium:solute symporter family protein [Bacteriovoracaceae bacterium]